MTGVDNRRRWLALIVLCLGDLMTVLDTTIVNVALPSIREDLAFSQTSLVWVVNAYMLTFGGFLLLGGRLGDLYGNRRLFVSGIVFDSLGGVMIIFALPFIGVSSKSGIRREWRYTGIASSALKHRATHADRYPERKEQHAKNHADNPKDDHASSLPAYERTQ